jgi:hypothetical protein
MTQIPAEFYQIVYLDEGLAACCIWLNQANYAYDNADVQLPNFNTGARDSAAWKIEPIDEITGELTIQITLPYLDLTPLSANPSGWIDNIGIISTYELPAYPGLAFSGLGERAGQFEIPKPLPQSINNLERLILWLAEIADLALQIDRYNQYRAKYPQLNNPPITLPLITALVPRIQFYVAAEWTPALGGYSISYKNQPILTDSGRILHGYNLLLPAPDLVGEPNTGAVFSGGFDSPPPIDKSGSSDNFGRYSLLISPSNLTPTIID